MSSPDHPHRKKRAGKACDSCRIKKTKCDGRKPCLRCIADNRICAYSDKRKKEKSHPPGYVELLETRVELLTRLLEQIVRLLEPHLPWLSQLMEKAKHEEMEHSVPINDVVNHLIAEHGILENMPMEWDLDPHDVLSAEEEDFVTGLDNENPAAVGHKRVSHSRLALDRSGRSLCSRRGSHLHQHPPSITEQFNMDSVSLAGYSPNSNNTPSLFRQDTSPIFSRSEMINRPTGQILASHEAASLLLLLALLAAKLESHDIGPTSPGLPLHVMTPSTLLLNSSEPTIPFVSSQGLRRHASLNSHNTASGNMGASDPRARNEIKTQHFPVRQNTSSDASLVISPYAAGLLPEVDEFSAFPMDDPPFSDLDDAWRFTSLKPGSAGELLA
ncbi:hypothetical protein C7M61_002524 [Candidozyma pseudohaemuli]|uniref:Zn(2)-C6 fungal-type domain-containing protein n=1 Tax=Candidozyma pseudohaemuli TaxID=418784 RepID=A0A2P7YRJ8_9ASCO|nr:hypothetical protein C7M61_002524 [[Candida] pseudohaemulonii]PSK38590.1 hypothetical protein C7M61_002524 [[Candida] pseudohaemulonii]